MNYGHYGRDLLLELHSTDSSSQEVWLPPYNDTLVQAALQDLQLHVQALQDQVTAAAAATAASSKSSTTGDTTSTDDATTTPSTVTTTTPTTTRILSKKPSLAIRPSLLLQEAAIQRNKRCLVTYHWVRLQRWQRLYHQNNTTSNNKNNNNNLALAEQDFGRDYQALQTRFVQNCGLSNLLTNGRLTAHALPPTANDKVTVRVVRTVPHNNNTTSSNSNSNSSNMDADQQQLQQVVLNSGLCLTLIPGSTHSLGWADALEWIRAGVLQVVRQEEEAQD